MPGATDVIAALKAIADKGRIDDVARFFKGDDPNTRIMGIPIGKVFPVAKGFTMLPIDQIEPLLDDPHYEVRMAAVSIMDFKARQKRLSDTDREALFALYLRRHDRINNWDLVDRAAPHVIGAYLIDRDRSILRTLARSDNPHERRTALVATYAFIRQGQMEDTFAIADILADDPDPYVQKAIASWTREAGKRDRDALVSFLHKNRDRLARPTLTNASKHLPDAIRDQVRK